ncbi:MAG: hypothetical protein IPI52_00645 [Bacteroidetes bacterium]|jgi:hypothetical protein|nr:hypothetical protein [Bacteroidota bacterium]MBP9135782.1 hypothetical protein [Chitinophagales bacterium]MBK7503661.1 hypothetical protein [Bacteroidota bacterium]MBK7638899.1 hypothetical protein [Bacteroidota bacterium]MBK9353352.1 hypothetical protein [Bacteroidota bacterium]
MNKSILKPIIGGALLGTFVFFTGPLLFIVLLLKFIFTPFGMGRARMIGQFSPEMGMPPFAFAEKIRSMNDEEFNAMKEKMKSRFGEKCN